MRTSIANCTLVTPRSAAILAGCSIDEVHQRYSGKPPRLISFKEVWDWTGEILKNGGRKAPWFISEAAAQEPLLQSKIEHLLELLWCAFPRTTFVKDQQELLDLQQYFRHSLPPKPTIGGALEVLRMLVQKYEHLTGPLYAYVERLSKLGFFEL